jgi:hypothetical protein
VLEVCVMCFCQSARLAVKCCRGMFELSDPLHRLSSKVISRRRMACQGRVSYIPAWWRFLRSSLYCCCFNRSLQCVNRTPPIYLAHECVGYSQLRSIPRVVGLGLMMQPLVLCQVASLWSVYLFFSFVLKLCDI